MRYSVLRIIRLKNKHKSSEVHRTVHSSPRYIARYTVHRGTSHGRQFTLYEVNMIVIVHNVKTAAHISIHPSRATDTCLSLPSRHIMCAPHSRDTVTTQPIRTTDVTAQVQALAAIPTEVLPPHFYEQKIKKSPECFPQQLLTSLSIRLSGQHRATRQSNSSAR